MITITGILMLILFAAGMPVAFSIIIVVVIGLLVLETSPSPSFLTA